MKYSLENSNKKNIITFKHNKSSLEIKIKHKVNNIYLESKIVLIDNKIISDYITEMIGKKLNKIMKDIQIILNEDEADESGSSKVFGELDLLRSILENQYKKFLDDLEYKEFLATILLAQRELRDAYMQKIFIQNYRNSIYNVNDNYENKQGRGR